MFATLFEKAAEFKLEGQENPLAWAISANEKTVVMWSNIEDNTIITTSDYDGKQWILKTQKFVEPIIPNAYKIHLSEDGNTLVHQGNERIEILTWHRARKNGIWVLKNRTVFKLNNNPAIDKVYVSFYNNHIFAAYQDNLTIISRATQNFKMVRKQINLQLDLLQCFSFGYHYNHFAQITDEVLYFWERNNEAMWERILPAYYHSQKMPFYSSFQQNETKAFIIGSVQIFNYPERDSYKFQDERIIEKETQSALNYFFLNETQKSIDFWYRENQGIQEFKYESLNIQATSILLGLSGNVFLVQKQTKDGIQIELYVRVGQ